VPELIYFQHKINYYQYGNGPALLFAFHGFADNANLFENVGEVLSPHYTTIAIDLPFHGKTQWEGDIFNPEDIHKILNLLMAKYKFSSCSMICHSMGGRIIWALLPLMPTEIDKLFFLAPAGFQYTFTASRFWCPMWFRRRARNRFEESEGVLRFFDLAHKLKLMNRATYLVFKQQLDLPRRRARLLKTWMSMFYFPMGARKSHRNIINDYSIQCLLFYGKKDRITPAKCANKFVSQLKNSEICLLKGNHFFVRQHLAPQLKNWLMDNSDSFN
jgi:pimeloyl-ACP methyl ester carboxylesterase